MPVSHDEGRTTKIPVVRPSSFVILIILAYLVIGTLYAVKTPAWQVPDEPAHYNYVRFIAQGHGLPVLQSGDYDQAYLESIKAAKFPASMSVDSIRYESWQPPLYYILVTPVYLATGGSLLALRLVSVTLGGFVVLLAFLIVQRLSPTWSALALGTAAFVAFVPQHVAMMAGAQNDCLAELLLALIIYQIPTKYRISSADSGHSERGEESLHRNGETLRFAQRDKRQWLIAGVLLGLGLVTKGTVYIAVPLVAVAILLNYGSLPFPRKWTWMFKRAALAFVPALVIALPWWIRNAGVYGWPDFLASIRHDSVVIGQPTPAEWIARLGLGGYLREFIVITFHSFWGQFGWMGVPMNDRYYTLLAIASFVALAGFTWFLNVKFRILAPASRDISNLKGRAGIAALRLESWHVIVVAWILFAVIIYLVYNIKYVQFQGRYLFPALIPIGLAFTAGLRQWTTLLPRRSRDVALAIPFLALAALDVIALFRIVVPTLMR